VATGTTTDTVALNSGHIANNYDAQAVQDEINLQVKVTQEFDKNRQAARNELYANALDKEKQAENIRFENGGYDTEESRALDEQAGTIRQTAMWTDVALTGLLYGGTNTTHLLGGLAETQAKLAAVTDQRSGKYYLQKCDAPNVGCTYRQVKLEEITPEQANNIITISNPGILNPLSDALVNASWQNSTEVNQSGIVVIDNPATGSYVAELLYVAYDKFNDITGSHLPLTGAEIANQEVYKYAKDNKYYVDVSSHSRGGLTASNALQDLNNNQGIVGLPINESRFYGTATNVQDYANLLYYVNGSGQAYSSVHETDFVGRTPWLLGRSKYFVGGNEVTGGVDITGQYFYSHSSYRYEKPPEKVLNAKGEMVTNKAFLDYEKAWGPNPYASRPQLVKPTVKVGGDK
jgi:filamentous hemagglutinin